MNYYVQLIRKPAVPCIVLVIYLYFEPVTLPAQQSKILDHRPPGESSFRCMFYNVENLFDTLDDPKTEDSEFTPNGTKHWNAKHYHNKIDHIAKVIIALGGWDPPALVGLAEVENSQVLNDLTKRSPLSKFNYKIVHQESPDPRGIDAALLYRPDKLKLVSEGFFPVRLQNDETRDIVFAAFTIGSDTMNVFVNHWPSRWSGELATENLRYTAARCLSKQIDSIYNVTPYANVLAIGDFNDTPNNRSIHEILDASSTGEYDQSSRLINLAPSDEDGRVGTIFHRDVIDRWQIFDQILVSRPVLEGYDFKTATRTFQIFRPKWLLDKAGEAPYRSYLGPFYTGGFSDHLPVYVDIRIVNGIEKERLQSRSK